MAPKFDNTQIITHLNHSEFFNKINSENNPALIDESKRISYKIKNIIFRILGNRKKWDARTEKIDGSNIKRVIIFRQDGIGDYIVSTPVIGWLKSALPDVEIDVLTSFRNDFVVMNDPNVTSTFPVHHKKIIHTSTIKLFKLRKRKYDVVIALDFTRTTYSALFARIIAPDAEKITVMHPTRKEIYGLVFNRQTKIESGDTHWSQNMLKFVTENIEPVNKPDESAYLPYIYIFEKDYRSIVSLLEKFHLRYIPNKNRLITQFALKDDTINQSVLNYCIVNISAYTARNKLSLDTIENVCNVLCEKYKNTLVFITGSQDDNANIEKVVSNVNKPNCIELKLKLSEFVAFLAGAKFIITPDTATIHIAAAVGVPVVGIYSWFESARAWYPFNVPFSIVISKDNQTVNTIEPAQILEATEILLSQINNYNKF
ncbi:MAG: hypothetical protein A2X61_15650 [Ignavibacteria bacterium GWB2_35_12]|nr:MAG: hypothetical protein A2X63_04925 [Ignavibacteria bacterium GWA2_35_8]OGU40811.1 MAG: hypothetical protein A2X61_15650 [Ignavibacteria bacterium GWB2_35_12]OGU96312.1 MAG: hypothetical protein A2220_02665 [Ignavibacteria bacterium RIFOXYA2_FULL_35_10]OGV24638.1 MAG: hypothetical protein A2475_14425 [Ignavibacteria bacterium RIFOXYC2_FULL_35_21]